MIYLFNSATRDEYHTNVLNTLHLPCGIDNEYRYSIGGEHQYVEETLLSFQTPGEDVMIIFIDRFSEKGFTYYPLRKGKFIKTEEKGSKIYFSVQLCDHYAVENLETFNLSFTEKFKDFIPTIGDMDPLKDGPGYFAFKGDDISSDFPSLRDPWSKNVERISVTTAFKDSNAIFTKVDIEQNKRKVDTKSVDNSNRLQLSKGKTYKDGFIPQIVNDRKKTDNLRFTHN